MSLANDEMGPLNRIRELEEENSRLREDNIELRRQLEDRSAQFLRPDIGRRTSDFSPNDSYRGDSNTAAWGDFEYKKSSRLSNGSDPDRDYVLVCSLPLCPDTRLGRLVDPSLYRRDQRPSPVALCPLRHPSTSLLFNTEHSNSSNNSHEHSTPSRTVP
jgi:hypothetical protein